MKKVYAMILAVALSLLLSFPVMAGTVSSVTAEATTTKVTFSGTCDSDVKAGVIVEVLDKNSNSMAMYSTIIKSDGTYSGTVDGLKLTEGETYQIRVADYDGGTWCTKTVTVPKTVTPPTSGGNTNTGSTGTSSSGSSSSDTTTTNTSVLVETVTATATTTTNKTTQPTKTPSKTEEKTDEKLVLPYQQAKEEPVSGTLQVSFGEGTVKVSVESQDEKGNTKGDVITGVTLGSFDNVLNAVLTEEEKKEVKAGNNVEVRLSMKKLTQEIPVAEQTAMEELVAQKSSQISGLTIGTYMDISMEKKLGNKDWKKLTNLNEEVEVTIDVPKDLQMDRAQYWVVKSHNGEVSLLEDLDNKEDTITIKSGEFSTYAIAYAVSNVEDADGVESVEDVSVEEVQTQETDLAWYWWLLPVAVLVIAIVGYTVYKKNSSEEKHTK